MAEGIVTYLSWYKCYKEGWSQDIQPESYSHPAKAARGLARRIYAHAIERGYLMPGDTCLDPFAGIGGFALDALANGIHFVGVELEQNFVDMGEGCNCTGISKADWVRCFGRWKRFAHKDGRHWCPRCLAEAGQVVEPRPPTLPGMGPKPTASYERSSGKIPHIGPHRYAGNLELFARHARDGATAVLVQGDSRRLVEVLEGARAEGIISSPPYIGSFTGEKENPEITRERMRRKGHSEQSIAKVGDFGHSAGLGYGTDARNLGNMPTGEPPSAVISSPPLGKAQSGGTSFWEGLEEKHGREFSDKVREGSQGYREDQLGDSEGQLGTMPTGEPPQAVIGSPPHGVAGIGHDAGHPRLDATEDTRREAEGSGRRQAYGQSDGQLAAMREGDVDAVIASPPWQSSSACEDPNYRTDRQTPGGPLYNDYGESDGQLAALPEGEPPAGIVQVDSCISSPPWEQSGANLGDVADTPGVRQEISDRSHSRNDAYGQTNGQLGNTQNDTFWSAARAILDQCHAVLAPGGVAIFVTKRFVRDKKIVEFSQQWADLCQSCGFELIEWIRAWLIEERGTQYDLEGEAHTKTVKRFSFFRRLHAQKYPHLAIEWEDVLIFRKGKE